MTEPLSSRVQQFEQDIELTHQMTHGDEQTTVMLGGVAVPSHRRQRAELLAELGAEAVQMAAWQAAQDAELHAAVAQSASDAALAGDTQYPDEATGRGAVADNALFRVVGSGDIACYIYKRINANTSQFMFALSSSGAVVSMAQLMSGPMRALIGSGTAAALARGLYTSGSGATGAGIYGWRSPFKHNGSRFDCVQLATKASVACNVRVEVQRANGTVIAHGQVWCGTDVKTLTIPLNRLVTDLAADEVAYIAYYSPSKAALLGIPGGGAYGATDADPTTYPEANWSGAAIWLNVVSPGAYRIHFRLLNLSDFSRSLADEAAMSTAAIGKVNGWPDQFLRRFAISTSALFGKIRWWGPTDAGWELVENTAFDGRALRRTVVGSAPLNGPIIHMSDLGIVTGNALTVCMLVKGNGCVVHGFGRFSTKGGAWVGDQQAAASADGAPSVTASEAPQLLRFALTMPDGATQFRLYPITQTAGGQFDIVAIWAYKGDASAGPAWPSLADADPYQDYAISDLTGRMTAVEVDVSPAVKYGFQNYEAVTADSTAVALAGSRFSSFARDLVFIGWGERYVPAGVSFNALRIVSLSRTAALETSKWRTLHVFVRAGANAHNGGTVVAVGEIDVPPDSDSLSNVTILLRDPTTGAIKTLSDADLSTEYFIGVYAKNAVGGWASCGEPHGTMPNSEGHSYYATSGMADPKAAAWAANSGNTRMGFQHLLLTNPKESRIVAPSTALAAAIAAANGDPAPELVTPPVIYGVQGRECNLYFDNVFLADAKDYFINVDSSGSQGQQQDERWTWMPGGEMTAGDVSLKVHSKRTGAQLVSKTIAQRAAASNAGAGMTKLVLVIGDSLINAGVITQTLLDIAATDVMGISLIGTRGTAPNRHEGKGGFTVNDYATIGRTYYRFTVSGISQAPAINSTKYSNNGAIYTVQETSLSGGAGTITCSVDSGGAPQASGALTKTFGTGDATIAFSAAEAVSGNPFWIGGQLNVAQYLSNNGFAAPDWVIIGLGINDIFGRADDAAASAAADSAFALLDNLIASIKAADENTKVGLMIPTPPAASQDAFGANYTSGQTRWRDKRNILIWARQLIARYTGQEANRIYLVPSNTAIDTVNNYPRAAATPVNSRNAAVSVARQNNSVHPDTSGYQQIGDAVWAVLKYYA